MMKTKTNFGNANRLSRINAELRFVLALSRFCRMERLVRQQQPPPPQPQPQPQAIQSKRL